MRNLDSILKSRDVTLLTKVCTVKSYAFSSSQVWTWELEHKEGWKPKNLCFWTVVLEKTLESPLDSKEIKPIHHKGNHSWIFIAETDAEAETSILRKPDGKSRLIGKGPDDRKEWRQEEKGTTEDEMVGWHHQLNGHEFEQAPGDSEGQASPACCRPGGGKESDVTERLKQRWYYCLFGGLLFYVSLRFCRYALTYYGFPGGSVIKNPLAKVAGAGDVGSIPGLGRSPSVGNSNPL